MKSSPARLQELYRAWRMMMKDDAKHPVCDAWRTSFTKFCNDMGEPPGKDCHIELYKGCKEYRPFTCKWSEEVQKERKKGIKYRGKFYSMRELAIKYEINESTLYSRVFHLGWTVNKAINHSKDKK